MLAYICMHDVSIDLQAGILYNHSIRNMDIGSQLIHRHRAHKYQDTGNICIKGKAITVLACYGKDSVCPLFTNVRSIKGHQTLPQCAFIYVLVVLLPHIFCTWIKGTLGLTSIQDTVLP